LELRNRFGVNILMIKRKAPDGSEQQIIPSPSERIETGDVLIALGREKDLNRLRRM
ncbi:MAG: hypothetical protein D6681_22615, partial [Calditrichaeota bacterium]